MENSIKCGHKPINWARCVENSRVQQRRLPRHRQKDLRSIFLKTPLRVQLLRKQAPPANIKKCHATCACLQTSADTLATSILLLPHAQPKKRPAQPFCWPFRNRHGRQRRRYRQLAGPLATPWRFPFPGSRARIWRADRASSPAMPRPNCRAPRSPALQACGVRRDRRRPSALQHSDGQ